MEQIEDTLPAEEKCLGMLREMYVRDVTNNMRVAFLEFSQEFKHELSRAISTQ